MLGWGGLHARELIWGPVLGEAHSREIVIGMQLDGSAEVQILYWESGEPGVEKSTPPIQVQADPYYSTSISISRLKPGTRYEYAILVDEDPLLLPYRLRFSTPPLVHPDAADFPTFTFCLLSGVQRHDPETDSVMRRDQHATGMISQVLAQDPDFILWLGNTYYLRPGEAGSPAAMTRRLEYSRNLPDLMTLLATRPNWATWSTAETEGSALGAFHPHFLQAKTIYAAAWPTLTPTRLREIQPTPRQFYYGDLSFHVLDTNAFRKPEVDGSSEGSAILGQAQIDNLIRQLKSSQAAFKLVCAGSPLIHPGPHAPGLGSDKAEQEYLMERLRQNPIDGLFFLTGGLGMGEFTKRVRSGAVPLYELAVGPLTAPPANSDFNSQNYYREPGTGMKAANYALIRVDGPAGQRKLEITVYNEVNVPVWSAIIHQDDLRHR